MNVTKRKAREMEKKRKIPKNGRYGEIKNNHLLQITYTHVKAKAK